MICRLCGQRHASREDAAAAHAPRPVSINTPVPEEQPDTTSPISKAGQYKEVIYRGRTYLGIIQEDGRVLITLKNGKEKLV